MGTKDRSTKMLYVYRCPECEKVVEVQVKLKDCDKTVVQCDNPEHGEEKPEMVRELSATPKSSSWSDWNK